MQFGSNVSLKRFRDDENDNELSRMQLEKKHRTAAQTSKHLQTGGVSRCVVPNIEHPRSTATFAHQGNVEIQDEYADGQPAISSPRDTSMTSEDEDGEDRLAPSSMIRIKPEYDLEDSDYDHAESDKSTVRPSTWDDPSSSSQIPTTRKAMYEEITCTAQDYPSMTAMPNGLDKQFFGSGMKDNTMPSAAEATGSQLSMLSVSDMEVEPEHASPIVVFVRNENRATNGSCLKMHVEEGTLARKQRLRSGALSCTNAPLRADNSGNTKRGFAIGFRADCEKCKMRVPGHMNHFIG